MKQYASLGGMEWKLGPQMRHRNPEQDGKPINRHAKPFTPLLLLQLTNKMGYN